LIGKEKEILNWAAITRAEVAMTFQNQPSLSPSPLATSDYFHVERGNGASLA
jgi:hypothetical protein